MGTDMNAHLEYRYPDSDSWVSLSNWDLIRDYDMYRLLANVRGEGALYPPRGIPSDAGDRARRAYLMPVADNDERLRRLRTHNPLAVSRNEAEDYVARGLSEWWPESDHGKFIINTGFRGESWLTTSEFRQVVNYYVAHVLEWRVEEHTAHLDRWRDKLGEEEYQRRLAIPSWDTSLTPEQWLSPEFWMLLTAMETGEARGFQVRLIFGFA